MEIYRHQRRVPLLIFLTNLVMAPGCVSVPPAGEPPPPIAVVDNLTGVAGFRPRPAEFIAHPVPTAFSICYGNTCANRARISLSSQEWNRVREVFTPAPASPGEERTRIGRAIALLEQFVGAQTGTAVDLGKDAGFGRIGQLDCIDEAANTTVYTVMLNNDGLLRWHSVGGRETRGPLPRWPHSTSVIRDNVSGTEYAVDAWFLANGEPPFIVPMTDWRAGWRPPGL